MTTRGVRGATTVDADAEDLIIEATRELLQEMILANHIRPEKIAAAFFTVTEDLTTAFPARAARLLGWHHVPLLDAQEIPVPDSLPRCIRVLLLWNTDTPQESVKHIYQKKARNLRPDINEHLSE